MTDYSDLFGTQRNFTRQKYSAQEYWYARNTLQFI